MVRDDGAFRSKGGCGDPEIGLADEEFRQGHKFFAKIVGMLPETSFFFQSHSLSRVGHGASMNSFDRKLMSGLHEP